MDDRAFEQKLAELYDAISTVAPRHRQKLAILVARLRKRHRELSGTVRRLQETIDFLRISVTYLLFDFEAMRRERRHARGTPDSETDADEVP